MKIPETIAELRAICQQSPQWQVHQPWTFLQIRKASIYLTWILLHFPITPNGVTLTGIGMGIVASLLFGGEQWLAGIIALQLTILLDFSDGEVSRYRKQQSKQGSYLDKVYHFTVQPSLFAGLTIGAYQARPSLGILVAGFISTICVAAFVMVMSYANELAVWKHCKKLVDSLNGGLDTHPAQHPALAAAKQRLEALTSSSDATGILQSAKQSKFSRQIAELAGRWDFPYIFFVITAAALLQLLVPAAFAATVGQSPIEIVLLFYAVTYPCWMLLFLVYVLASKSTERGYAAFADDLFNLVSAESSATADRPDEAAANANDAPRTRTVVSQDGT